MSARVIRLVGPRRYAEVHALQERLVAERAAGGSDVLLLLEHSPTVTLGRKLGAMANVLRPDGVDVVQVERGGDVTWHGPGQLVAYPIVGLEGAQRDLRGHLRRLEQAVIDVLTGLGLPAARDERNTGVWLPCVDGEVRKVCSIGVACRGWVTWHGLALNVDNDPEGFLRIRPCGFGADVMTRLADHLAPCPSVEELTVPIAAVIAENLGLAWDGVIERDGGA